MFDKVNEGEFYLREGADIKLFKNLESLATTILDEKLDSRVKSYRKAQLKCDLIVKGFLNTNTVKHGTQVVINTPHLDEIKKVVLGNPSGIIYRMVV